MRQFAQLFEGRQDCFGIYRVLENRADGKQKGKGTTYPNERYPDRVLLLQDWLDHLDGKQMLGIVPVRPDGTCCWFAIDVDDYAVNLRILSVEIERQELPLVLCRSKSGGAHLYCFINGYIQASLAIDLGKKWAKELGYERAEVFPKQARFDDDKAKGNWIIVPYYGRDRAADFALGIGGEQLDFDSFLLLASAKEITPAEASAFLTVQKKKMGPEDVFAQTPPCIQKLMESGIHEGGRNNTMRHFGTYYQKLDAHFGTDDWRDKLQGANNTYCDPPMGWDEMDHIIKSIARKQYEYGCKIEPMCSLCDKAACLKRTFGVGEEKVQYGEFEISSMLKIDSRPPIWIPKINGTDIEMDTDTLLNPRKFRMAVADILNILVPQIKQTHHDAIIAPIMASALTIEPMEEMTMDGKVMSIFQEWTKNMVLKSRSMDDLEKGLPFYNKEDNTIYCRGADFMKEFRRSFKDNTTERQIWAAMRRSGFIRKQIRKGKSPDWVWLYNLDLDEMWFDLELGEQF